MKAIRKLFVCIFMLSLFALASARAYAEDSDQNETKGKDQSETVSIYTGVGLFAVGGAGALVVAHNSKKEKNVPSKEIESKQED